MNTEDIKYFNGAGLENLRMNYGEDNVVNFFMMWCGKYEEFHDPDYQYDGSEGQTYVMKFFVYLKKDVDFDGEFFAEEMVRKHSPFYAHGCYCEHDCCGHAYTANIDIYYKKKDSSIHEDQTMYTFMVLIHNGRNL